MAEEDIGTVTEDALLTLLGKTLRALRLKAELTQERLAARAATSQNQVSDWETGKSWIELKSMTSVINGLGVSLAAFAAVLAQQARKLTPDSDWERWFEATEPGNQPEEVAEPQGPGSHVYIVIAAPADRVKTFTGGEPRQVLGPTLAGGKRPETPE